MRGEPRRGRRQRDAADAARVAVVTGAGDRAFCAGADLLDTAPAARAAALAGQPVDWHFGGITRLPTEKPVVAAVNGHALAGGLELALACDVRVASPAARLGLAETRWGLVPGAGGTVRLPRLVPAGIALEMALTAEPLDAHRALAVGLLNRVVDADDLLTTALDLARLIASRGPLAVRSARRSVRDALGLDEPVLLERELAAFTRVIATDDAAEGVDAFAQRRVPVYEGR